MSSLVLVAYEGSDPNGTALGTLVDAYAKALTVEDNAIGQGSFSIHPSSSQIAWCAQGNYVRVRQNSAGGAVLGGFWIEGEEETVLSPQEEGGRERRRSGRGPIAILRKAIVWRESVLSAEPDEPITQPGRGRWFWKDAQPAAVIIRLLKEAQERGAIQAVTWDFSRTHDSDGNPWDADLKGKFDMPIGRTLLEAVGIVREADIKIECSPSFVLSAWPEPHDNDLSGSIEFAEGVNVRDTSDRQVAARRSASVALVGGQEEDGRNRYQAARNATIESQLGERIEAFIEYQRTPNLAIMKRVGLRRLRRWKKQHDGPLTLGVLDGAAEALIDYTAGDTVGLDVPGAPASDRIVSITLEELSNGEYDPILQFGDLGEDSYTGRDMGGEGRSGGTNPGPGGGDDPGEPSTGGSGTTPPTQPTDVGEYEIENWNDAAAGLPSRIEDQTTVSTGTVHTVALTGLPDLDVAYTDRWLVLAYCATDADGGLLIPAQLGVMGFAQLRQAAVGSNSIGVFVQPLDGSQWYDAADNTLTLTTPGSETIIWYVSLVQGISQWTISGAPGDATTSISGWTGEQELVYTFGFDDAAVAGGSAGPPFNVIESQASGGAALRVVEANLTGATNPPDWTMTGGAQYSVTLGGRYTDPGWGVTLRGQGIDNGAPWVGANHWNTGVGQGSALFTTTTTKGLITINADNTQAYAGLESDSIDDANGEPWGVWADADGTMRCRWQVNRLGNLADAFGNIIWWEVEAYGYRAGFLVHLGDNVSRGYMTTGTRGIVILQGPELSPTASPFVTKSLAAATDYDVRFDFRNGRARMKLWEAGTAEPVAWDIDEAKVYDFANTGGVARFWMHLWGGTTGSNLAASYDTLWGGLAGSAGGGLPTAGKLPRGDGTTTTWTVTPWIGPIELWVDGVFTEPASFDRDAGTFTFSRAPAKGAYIVARYTAA